MHQQKIKLLYKTREIQKLIKSIYRFQTWENLVCTIINDVSFLRRPPQSKRTAAVAKGLSQWAFPDKMCAFSQNKSSLLPSR